MPSYMFFDLCIHSEVELPGLLPGGDEPDLVIRWGRMKATSREKLLRRRAVTGGFEKDLAFRVEDGRSIVLAPLRDLDEDIVRTYILGSLMAIVLRQRGYMVLHASCVEKDGEAVGFVGSSGWGKSTLASYFCRKGYRLLDDDIMAIGLGGADHPPFVLPGGSHIRLRPGTGGHLFENYEDLPYLSAESIKRVHYVNASEKAKERARLKRVYVLEPTPASASDVIDLPTRAALLQLIKHSRMVDVLPAVHLKQSQQLVKRVPIKLLRRVAGLDKLETIYQAVVSDLGDAGAADEDHCLREVA